MALTPSEKQKRYRERRKPLPDSVTMIPTGAMLDAEIGALSRELRDDMAKSIAARSHAEKEIADVPVISTPFADMISQERFNEKMDALDAANPAPRLKAEMLAAIDRLWTERCLNSKARMILRGLLET